MRLLRVLPRPWLERLLARAQQDLYDALLAPPHRDRGVTHMAPTSSADPTLCCARRLDQLDRYDRITRSPTRVTCPRMTPHAR